MSIIYLDTSALVKQYIAEIGSDWVRGLPETAQASRTFTSRLTVVEAACAFARRRREGTLSLDAYRATLMTFNYDVRYHCHLLDVEPPVVEIAQQMADRHPLRAYDAVQLATAWLTNRALIEAHQSPLLFVCADDRLLSIAQTEGLLTDNPNQHP